MSGILDLIDGALWDYGDAMRWSPEPIPQDEPTPSGINTGIHFEFDPWRGGWHTTDSHGRVPYGHLTDDERQALHDWCTRHDIDYRTVPIDPNIERVGDLWVIEVYDQHDGASYIDPTTGDIARAEITRPYKSDLPWRRPCPE